jgi:hypothetical protein
MVTETSLTLIIDGKDRKIYVDVETGREKQGVCVLLGHGASGEANSGNLPRIAKCLAEEGHLVVRYDASGQLPARKKVLQVQEQLAEPTEFSLHPCRSFLGRICDFEIDTAYDC